MSDLLKSIPFIGGLFDKTLDMAKEAVTDKDKQNALIGSLEDLRQNVGREIYMLELQTKTIPWVDALHKMGRQIINLATIVAVTILLLKDIDITGPAALVLGGGNVAYQVIKGQGKK